MTSLDLIVKVLEKLQTNCLEFFTDENEIMRYEFENKYYTIFKADEEIIKDLMIRVL